MTAVHTSFNYSIPGQQFGYVGTASVYQQERDVVPVTVSDARNKEDSFSLDREGFEFHTFPKTSDFPDDREQFKATHYPEVIDFLKTKSVIPPSLIHH